MNKLFLGLIALPIFISCHSHDHPHDEYGGHSHDDHGHNHGEVHKPHLETLSHTIWTDESELFVEFKPLIVSKETPFAAHFSNMKTFKAVKEGSVKVSLIGNGAAVQNQVDAPTSPGIFRPVITPDKKGVYQLVFEIKTPSFSDKIIIDSVSVYASEDDALANQSEQAGGDEISFLKEQAWKIDFAIAQAQKGSVHQTISSAGKIEGAQGDEKIITAKSDGVVLFKGKGILAGNSVSNEQTLFSIAAEGNTEGNIQVKFAEAKSTFEKAKAEFERSEKLVKDQIISQKEFNEIKSEFEIAKTNYNNLLANYSDGGTSVKSPFNGYLKSLLVKEGQFVRAGEQLAVITKNQKLMIKVDVPQKYFGSLPSVFSANFHLPYQKSTYSLEELNGRMVSYGKSVKENSGYLPVYFEVDNKGQLLSGAFVEVTLKTKDTKEAITVPASAIMSDYESPFVYVQTGGESFEKKQVVLGVNDGVSVEVISGLNEGDWVVAKGAYQVKMASMSSSIPAHGHSH